MLVVWGSRLDVSGSAAGEVLAMKRLVRNKASRGKNGSSRSGDWMDESEGVPSWTLMGEFGPRRAARPKCAPF